ncbi:oxidoreductase [Saccharibacillus kuerlensis]|uniref:Short-chain dehydrogenase/reductase n=1 Tax=Saccharibacillus kuerlensis TaxID=459527 RepID=A0ABQ2L3C8_9BACL|nr:oxidoreductase [Saccharibacillus kuerlensis]GGO01046.1 short-chain dehydrogenase/reductase [Saccharibacillus kuerlensis]
MSESKKRVVLITGASAGMGKATANLLLQQGYIVYGAARRVERMKDLEAKGGHILEMDVTDDQSMQNGIDRIIREQGRIDVLFNNAGYGSFGAVEDVPMEEARRQMEVNLFGASRLTQLVLPFMRAQQYGKIINNSSVGGKVHTLLGAWYHAGKHALEGYSDCLRLEVAPFGIDVVVIEPGIVESEWGEVALEHIRKTSSHTPYHKMAEAAIGMFGQVKNPASPDVIAHVVLKAIEARKPKTRYAAGKQARSVLLLRKVLSDRMMDRVIYRMFKFNI